MNGSNITYITRDTDEHVVADGLCRIVGLVADDVTDGTVTLRNAGTLTGAVAASGVITCVDGGTETDAVTIDDQVFTLDDTPVGDNQLATEATAPALAAALHAAIVGHTDYATFSFTAALSFVGGNVIEVTIKVAGTAGNALVLSETGASFTTTGAGFFAGGVDEGDAIFHVAAIGMPQAGKQFSPSGARLSGLTAQLSDAGDAIGVIWAPKHS